MHRDQRQINKYIDRNRENGRRAEEEAETEAGCNGIMKESERRDGKDYEQTIEADNNTSRNSRTKRNEIGQNREEQNQTTYELIITMKLREKIENRTGADRVSDEFRVCI